jgi:hypothetical protein
VLKLAIVKYSILCLEILLNLFPCWSLTTSSEGIEGLDFFDNVEDDRWDIVKS